MQHFTVYNPGEGHGNPLQYSCLENPMDRGAWRATVHGVSKSQIRLTDWTNTHAQDTEIHSFLSRDSSPWTVCVTFTGSRIWTISSHFGPGRGFLGWLRSVQRFETRSAAPRQKDVPSESIKRFHMLFPLAAWEHVSIRAGVICQGLSALTWRCSHWCSISGGQFPDWITFRRECYWNSHQTHGHGHPWHTTHGAIRPHAHESSLLTLRKQDGENSGVNSDVVPGLLTRLGPQVSGSQLSCHRGLCISTFGILPSKLTAKPKPFLKSGPNSSFWDLSMLFSLFSCSVVSDSLQPHEVQHARPPCPSPTPRVHPNPCPLSRWRHPTISSSVVPFSSCPQSLPASGSYPRNRLFASGGLRIGVSA